MYTTTYNYLSLYSSTVFSITQNFTDTRKEAEAALRAATPTTHTMDAVATPTTTVTVVTQPATLSKAITPLIEPLRQPSIG
jgi:hypothetical protein